MRLRPITLSAARAVGGQDRLVVLARNTDPQKPPLARSFVREYEALTEILSALHACLTEK
jgi:hypothetical protein